jgi:peptidoglycan lytic transglycosylase
MSRFLRFVVIVAGAATLAACAQSSTQHSGLRSTAVRQAAIEQPRRPVAVASVVRRKPAAETSEAVTSGKGGGVASYYWQGTKTASGEKFDPKELTAAHPTLPFGTKLRVTNTHTGQSVTVRVNDRGPYVPGRVVDVSYSAAQELGMINRGVAKVKLDVVQ